MIHTFPIPFLFVDLLFLIVILYDSYYFGIFLYESLKKNKAEFSPFITVIVPVYNDEPTIEKCILSILASEYEPKEVIVVDDGSTDRTKDVVDSFITVKVYHIPHSGKAAALNFGIEHAKGDIVVVDADTVIEKDTLKKLVRNLERYDAVAGNVQVSNTKGFLGRCQAVEHVRVAMFRKVAQHFKDIDIVPGPLGAFKKEIFSQVQYGTSVVEDMELTQAVKKNYAIGYEQEARAYTEMPVTWGAFLKQRFRWARGNLELLFGGRMSVRKVLTGYFVACADVALVILCLVNQSFELMFLFFLFESFTMFIGNCREKTKYYIESVLFPVFMLFLDFIFLLSHSAAALSLFKAFLGNLLQKSKPRT